MTKDREALLYILDHYKDFGIKKSDITYKLIYELLCDGVADIGGKRSEQIESRIDKLIELLDQHKIGYKIINIAPRGGSEGERITLTDQTCIEEIRLEKLALIDENIKRTLEDFKLDCLYKFGKKKGMKAIEYFDKFLNQEWKLSSEFEEYLNSHILCRESEEYIYPSEEPSYKIQAAFNGVKISDIYKETLRRYLLHRIHIINGVYKRVQRTPIWLERRNRELNKNISVPSFKANKYQYPEISIEEDNTKVEDFSGLDFIPSGFKCETHSGYCLYKGNRLSYIVQLWIAKDKSFQYRLKGKICKATYLKFVHTKSTATSSTLLEACEEAVRWGSFYEFEQRKQDEERQKTEQREASVAKWHKENNHPGLDSFENIKTEFKKQNIKEEEFEFPSYIRKIGYEALYANKSIKKLHIPFSVDEIDSRAFANMQKLEEVVIDAPIKSLPLDCFYECKKLKRVTLTHGLEYIPSNAFYGCTSLEKIILPDSCKKIGEWSFGRCTNLKEVVISSDAIIEKFAFRSCPCENEEFTWRAVTAKVYFGEEETQSHKQLSKKLN